MMIHVVSAYVHAMQTAARWFIATGVKLAIRSGIPSEGLHDVQSFAEHVTKRTVLERLN